jgi:hypothetical protein
VNARAALAALFPALAVFGADPALTIYNQNFAVVREMIPLELKAGVNRLQFTGTTAQLEPDSVILRDPSGRRFLRILEQDYRADPVSMDLLMTRYEGQTIDFLVHGQDKTEIVTGKIVRSGSGLNGAQRFQGRQAQPAQPIIEIGGKLRFELPGTPLFPALASDTILKPTLDWAIETDKPGKLDAELCYVSGGMTWESDYNVVALNGNDALEIVGWVTMSNDSGKTFENARIKLMAGDVNKLRPEGLVKDSTVFYASAGLTMGGTAPPVTEKTFDEYHLYTLERSATLHDRETKQVEFVRAAGVASKIVYVYEGLKIDNDRYRGWPMENIRQDASYGVQSNPKVWVMREFINSTQNHLGMPLPRGRVRFYRRDTEGRMEFTGEDRIEHTPRDETVRLFTGAAFDLVGERKRVDYRLDAGRREADESFEIKVRNRKTEPVEITVVEHLYRWYTWDIRTSSLPYTKKDSQTIEFKVPLAPGEEKTVSYNAHYSW